MRQKEDSGDPSVHPKEISGRGQDRTAATGFAYDPLFLKHDTGAGHPECPERLTATLDHLNNLPWFSKLQPVAPRKAEMEWIYEVHKHDYVERAHAACREGLSALDTPDVVVSASSFEAARVAAGAALVAAGAALELVDQLMSGRIRNGFGLLRPPGHHAERDFAMGFCLFNNAAIAARCLQKKHGLERVLILDWDVHHGNGTQHFFEADPGVLYVSLHQYPFYPGTGSRWETGIGKGKGSTFNCPMKAGAGDKDYERAFKEEIIPKVKEFKPDAVVISAGFDAHVKDPLADIRLSSDCFGWMTDRVVELAATFSKGRIVSLLEGGYSLEALPECVERHLHSLSGR